MTGGSNGWFRTWSALGLVVACGGRTTDDGFLEGSGGSSATSGNTPGGQAGYGYGGKGYGGDYGVGGGVGAVGGGVSYGGKAYGGSPYGGAAGNAYGGYSYGGYGYSGYAGTGYGGKGYGGYAGSGYGGKGYGGKGYGGYAGSCCESHVTRGCSEPDTASCVCAFDPYCCNTAWDDICVGEVEPYGCGSCSGGYGGYDDGAGGQF